MSWISWDIYADGPGHCDACDTDYVDEHHCVDGQVVPAERWAEEAAEARRSNLWKLFWLAVMVIIWLSLFVSLW